MKKRLLLWVGLLVLGMQVFAATFSFNFDGKGFISDGADVLDAADKEKISFYADYVKAQTSYRILVVTLETLEGVPASQVARVVAEHGVGGNQDDMLVFLVAPTEGKIGIKIGENLKSEISYVALKNIIQEEVSPSFKNGDYSHAITRGIYYISRIIEPSLAFVKQEKIGNSLAPMSKPMPKTFELKQSHFVALWITLITLLFVLVTKKFRRKTKARRGGFGNQFSI